MAEVQNATMFCSDMPETPPIVPGRASIIPTFAMIARQVPRGTRSTLSCFVLNMKQEPVEGNHGDESWCGTLQQPGERAPSVIILPIVASDFQHLP